MISAKAHWFNKKTQSNYTDKLFISLGFSLKFGYASIIPAGKSPSNTRINYILLLWLIKFQITYHITILWLLSDEKLRLETVWMVPQQYKSPNTAKTSSFHSIRYVWWCAMAKKRTQSTFIFFISVVLQAHNRAYSFSSSFLLRSYRWKRYIVSRAFQLYRFD